MGRSRYLIHENQAPHFLTCTVLQWLPLFAQPENARIVLDCLRFLQNEGRLVLYGYVLLENHCHLIARGEDLGKAVASFNTGLPWSGMKPALRAATSRSAPSRWRRR